MNTEKRRQTPIRGQGEDMLSPNRPPHTTKKQPNPLLLCVLRRVIFGIGCITLILSLLLVILPLFKVQSTEVIGNGYYTKEQILRAAEISLGDESLALDPQQVCNRLFANAPYVQSCTVSVLPFSLKIEIKEKENILYARYQEKYISFEYNRKNGSFYVLEETTDRSAFAPFTEAVLPSVASAEVGKQIVFSNASLNLSYTQTLTEALKNNDLMDDVASIDFSKTTALSYEMKNGCTVKIGNTDDISTKLNLVKTLLANNGTLTEIDVRDIQAPTTKNGTES